MADADSTDDPTSEPPHLAIVGGGIAGCAAAAWAAGQGARVTLFNAGLPLGGTCLHVGAFPARTLMSAATDYDRARHPRFPGLDTDTGPPNLTALQQARRQMGDRIRRHQYERLRSFDSVELVDQRAQFADETTLRADQTLYEPDRVLLTPGSRSLCPDVQGLADVDPLSMRDLAELEELPDRIVFVEVNDVALAYAQLLARFGTDVTILSSRPDVLDPSHGDEMVRGALIDLLAEDGVDIVTDVQLQVAEPTDHETTRLTGAVGGESTRWEAEAVAVIDHHRPRTEDLNLPVADVDLTDEGFIVIDESLQTTNPNVYAAGDAVGREGHAYSAAYDAILAARNAISVSRTAGHTTAVPFTIYTDPALAGVGWTRNRAREAGFVTDAATCPLENIPAAEALGASEGFVKLIRDRRSDHLVGARVLAPNASELIMELALAVRYGLTVTELATLVHPPISLGEAISRAASRFTERQPGHPSARPGPPGG